MQCPHCKDECKALVLETRKQDGAIIRQRSCTSCEGQFLTREVADRSIILRRPIRPSKTARENVIEQGPKVTSLAAFRAWG